MPTANKRKQKKKERKRNELISEFNTVVGLSNLSYAKQMLEASKWNLESAVALHFSTGSGGGGGGGGRSSSSNGAGRSSSRRFASTASYPPNRIDPEVAAAAAAAGITLPSPNQEPEYRAPIASKRQRLADGFEVGYNDHMYPRNGGFGMGAPVINSNGASGGVFNQSTTNAGTDPFRSFAREAAMQRSLQRAQRSSSVGSGHKSPKRGTGKKKARDLAALFAPPLALLTEGTFDEIKLRAQKEERWLLVNIQRTSEFDSHRLNRDTFSHPMVQELVRGSFLFWQQQDNSGHGSRYISFYKPKIFPHIGLIDPRTGQLLETISGFIEPGHFASRLAEFLDNNSLSGVVKPKGMNHRSKEAQESKRNKNGKSRGQMDEDAQLARALAESLREAEGRGDEETFGDDDDQYFQEYNDSENDDGMDLSNSPISKEDKNSLTKTATEELLPPPQQRKQNEDERTTTTSPIPPSAIIVEEEPPLDNPEATSLALRFPKCGRITRRFLKSQKVNCIFDFVASKLSKTVDAFEIRLAFPRKDLSLHMSETLEEVGILDSQLLIILK
eukprot:g1978.t1